MHTRNLRARAVRAFTLVEILVVVIILGIAGAIIVPNLGTRDDLKAAAAARVIMADMIYTQNLAITNQGNRYMTFDVVAQKYSVIDNTGAVITHPVDHVPYIQLFSAVGPGRNIPTVKL